MVQEQATGKEILRGRVDQSLYKFQLTKCKPIEKQSNSTQQVADKQFSNRLAYFSYVNKASLCLWHLRLGYASYDVVRVALRNANIPYYVDNAARPCEPCLKAKSHRLPFGDSNSKYDLFDLVCSDIWGPSPVPSVNGFRYYLSFIDHASRYVWIYFLKAKFDTLGAFTHFRQLVDTQFGKKIKALQIDGGTEFKPLTKLLSDNGIMHRISCPYIPQQNGVAERKHRHIVEVALSFLAQSNVPSRFWVDAFAAAVYIINRTPNKVLDFKTPFQVLTGNPPDYSMLKVFGFLCFPHIRPFNKHKLEFRSTAAVFIGYNTSYKGYKVLLPSGKVIMSRHVKFDESSFPFAQPSVSPQHDDKSFVVGNSPINMRPIPIHSRSSLSLFNDVDVSSFSTQQDQSTPNSASTSPSHLTHSTSSVVPSETRAHSPPIDCEAPKQLPLNQHPMQTRAKAGIFKPKALSAQISFDDIEPQNFQHALRSPAWKKAMQNELSALARNQTWSLCTLPPNKELVSCKWIFKLKKDADGNIVKHKARLVARGFTQTFGLDYTDTFSPVVKPITMRTVLAIALSRNWAIHQIDVDNAFLNGELHEEIYLQQPPGFEYHKGSDLVCKLHKALYGLKQASRAWSFTLNNVLAKLGFCRSKADHCLYYRQSGASRILLITYVDDILITGSTPEVIQNVITDLQSLFALKDLGSLHQFLGIKFERTSGGLHLSQAHYILDILARVEMSHAKGVSSPMITSPLSKYNGQPTADHTLYRSVVGALQYVTITRPDVAYSVNKVSQYMHSPLDCHWKAVKRILRYLAWTLSYGLHLKSSSTLDIMAYSNSDWASDQDDRKSTSGYCVFLGNSLISWSARKQPTVSRSSTEAEFRSLTQTTCEVLWLQALLLELRICSSQPSIIWMDNLGAIALSANPVFHSRIKHAEVDFHFVREQVLKGLIHVNHLPSYAQVADGLTKPLTGQSFTRMRNQLCVLPPPTFGLRGRVDNTNHVSTEDYGSQSTL